MADYNFETVAKRKKRDRAIASFFGCLAMILAIVVILFLYAAIGMWLWNAIMVPVFAMPVLGYWQMYGIMILARMIFGGRSSSSSKD